MIRAKRQEDMQHIYPGVKRIMNPHHYHVSLTEKLWALKQDLVKEYSDGKKDD
jgi:nicotinate phosphoribosyltransferase